MLWRYNERHRAGKQDIPRHHIKLGHTENYTVVICASENERRNTQCNYKCRHRMLLQCIVVYVMDHCISRTRLHSDYTG